MASIGIFINPTRIGCYSLLKVQKLSTV